MDPSPSGRRSDWFVRALGVVLGGALLHLGLSQVLYALAAPPLLARSWSGDELITLVVVTTALSQLVILYLRAQYSTPSHATRSIPAVLRTVPPLALLLLAAMVLPPALLELPSERIVARLAPALGAVWSAGFMLSIPLKRMLHALAIRAPAPSLTAVLKTFDPPSMTGAYVPILAGASLSVSMLVLGAWVAQVLSGGAPAGLSQLAVLPGLGIVVGLAALAGMSLGQSPGEDLVSIARRLDAVGYDTPRPTEADAEEHTTRVAASSTDQVGELLHNLERLREHLGEELRLYETALDKTRAVDAVKSDFLNAVSHELRTPLGTIGGFAQLLLEGTPTPLTEAQAEDVRLIRAGGHQLLELINDILDVSMIESGDLRLEFAPTDLSAVIRDVVEIHQPLVHGRDTVLRMDVSSELPSAECDRRRIVQILTNLVSNAIKFTESGEIVVRGALDPTRERIVIRCIDTGVGIAPEELDQVFEEYQQAGPVKRRSKGTGLGLSIARTIAEHHGGDLTAQSTVGEGSTFTLSIPVAPPQRPTRIDISERKARARARRPSQRNVVFTGDRRPSG
ncbi:MAG: HAMP domain-containing sensor histidine kinase [Myxococcota bacterium]